MSTQIQIRRDTAANWTANNPTLAEGEVAYEIDTGKLKVGSSPPVAWNSLAYFTGSGGVTNVLGGAGLTATGTGVVTLDVGAGTGITVNADDIAVNMGAFSTTDLAEGTNLYHTAARVDAEIADYQGSINTPGTITAASFTGDGSAITGVGLSSLDTVLHDTLDFFKGCTLDDTTVTVTSNGTVVTVTWDHKATPGTPIRVFFSDGIYSVSTPATVAIAPGSNSIPVKNYVYLDKADKLLKSSTVYFPDERIAEHARVATVVCPSAARVQTHGVYSFQAWTDHASADAGQGHLSDINYWVRHQPAVWEDGVALTTTTGASTFHIATTAGEVLQLHEHDFPAFNTATGSVLYVVNDSVTPYTQVSNLTGVLTDSTGTTMAGTHYNLVIWGTISGDANNCQLFVNLPNGSYNNNNGNKATNDIDFTANYSIPTQYTNTGFLIARITVSEAAGTFTEVAIQDLRGSFPGIGGGGAGGGGASLLNELTDVDDTAKAANSLLVYNSTSQLWEASNNVTLSRFNETIVAGGSGGGAVSFDMNSGSIHTITLTSNVTSLALTNATAGASATIIVTQDATGSRTLTAGASWKWSGGVNTLSTAANAVDIISVIWDGTTYWASLTTDYQ